MNTLHCTILKINIMTQGFTCVVCLKHPANPASSVSLSQKVKVYLIDIESITISLIFSNRNNAIYWVCGWVAHHSILNKI